MNIFDHWKNLTKYKKEFDESDPEVESTYKPYVINRMASSVNAILPLMVDIDRYGDNLPKKTHYELMKCILPKAYIEVPFYKDKKDDDLEKSKKALQEYFEFGSRDLKLALQLMKPSDIEKIRRKYGGKEYGSK